MGARKLMIWIFLLAGVTAGAQHKVIKNLSGKWKFSLGNRQEWKNPDFDHSGWESIYVPSAWEMQGFNGYNGYAWYRNFISISHSLKKEDLVLELGYIDDVDAVYFNGHLIGTSGCFPPQFSTAYTARRLYAIPENLIKYDDKNLIAVKVFDQTMEGGINRGDIRLLSEKYPLRPFMYLQGQWDFKAGDNFSRKYDEGNESDWDKIYVPGNWENQGYKNLDGYAWYHKKFMADDRFEKDRVVLLMGKIDDLDEVFVNGIKIGQTGFMEPENQQRNYTKAYKQLRGYLVPEGVIKIGENNTVHVRVSDFYQEGGITEGPIGFISQTDYINYWRNKKHER